MPRHLTQAEAQDALRGTLTFTGTNPEGAHAFAQHKREQGLTVKISTFGGRFEGDTHGTTKVSFWLPAASFTEMLDEDIASTLKGYIARADQSIKRRGKTIGNRLMQAMGSQGGAGRADLSDTTQELVKQWRYYMNQQQLEQTVEGLLDFLATTQNMPLDRPRVYSALYGADFITTPPNPTSNNSNYINGVFTGLMNKTLEDNDAREGVANVVKSAKEQPADAKAVGEWMTFISLKNPEVLETPLFKPLESFSHGPKLSDQQIREILTTAAKAILKQFMANAQADAAQAAPGSADADGDASAAETAAAAAAGYAAGNDSGSKSDINLTPRATQQAGNWGGLKRPPVRRTMARETEVMAQMAKLRWTPAQTKNLFDNATNAKEFADWKLLVRKTYKAPEPINALSAMFMQMMVKQPTGALTSFMREAQTVQAWPQRNIPMAFDFIKEGGDYNEVTAELNHFCNTVDKAVDVFIGLIRFEALARARAGSKPAEDDKK